jgi:hypothetical protein
MRPHPAMATLRILWFALLASVFLYLGIAIVVLSKVAVKPQIPFMPFVLSGLSLVVAVVSFVLPPITYAQAAKTVEIDVQDEVAPSAFPSRYREAMPKRQVFSDPQAATSKAFALFMTPFILSLALSEAIALFGLVLVQMGFGVLTGLPFFFAGAVLIAVRFPTESKVLDMFEKARGASFPASNG